MSTGPAALCRPRHRLTGHTRGKGRRFGAASPAAAKLTGETDWLQEGAGFEPSVPRVMDDDLGRQISALIAVFELAGTAVALQRGTKVVWPHRHPEFP